MVVRGRGAVSYERGTPVGCLQPPIFLHAESCFACGSCGLYSIARGCRSRQGFARHPTQSGIWGERLNVLMADSLGEGHTRQDDVEVSPAQSRISRNMQRILRSREDRVWVQGPGFREHDSGFWVLGSGLRFQGPGSRVQGSGSRVQGSRFRVQGSGCRVQGVGCRVQGC